MELTRGTNAKGNSSGEFHLPLKEPTNHRASLQVLLSDWSERRLRLADILLRNCCPSKAYFLYFMTSMNSGDETRPSLSTSSSATHLSASACLSPVKLPEITASISSFEMNPLLSESSLVNSSLIFCSATPPP